MSRTIFEKFALLCIATGTLVLVFGTGVLIGDNRATKNLQQAATQNCGASFDKFTGDFTWTICPPFESEVIAPEPDPEEPVATTETVPTETPSEPVH